MGPSMWGLWPQDLFRPDPPNPSPPPKSSLHLLLLFSWYRPQVVGVVSQRSLFSSGCCLVFFSLFVYGAGRGGFLRLWTWVWAILVGGRGLPWRLFVLVLGVTYMLCCLVNFPWRILVSISLLMFACGSCPLCLLQWGLSGLGYFFPVVSHYGMFMWHVYVVYFGDGVQSVAFCGLLLLYEL